MSEHVSEVAIVGAGPIGIELAVALKKRGIDYIHFDARQVGHTISWFAPQTQFFSSNDRIAIAGVPLLTPDQAKATREQYLAYLCSVVEQFDLKIHIYQPIIGIKHEQGHFALTSQPRGHAPRVWFAKKLVLCTGGTDHPRLLDVPGENLPHVSHYFDDPYKYFQTDVLIVGGKNSAVESALRCHRAGARVTLLHRRESLAEKSIKYWLLPEINGLIKSGRIKSYFNSTVTRITPTHATISNASGQSDVKADFVLLLIGYQQDVTLLKLAGVELHGPQQMPAYNEMTMETSVPGLFVAGTATGGTQDKFTVFIENCHVHVDRIVAALTGQAPPAAKNVVQEQPES